MATATEDVRLDIRIAGLIGVAHYFSHFYQLALAPLFLIIHDDLGYSFTQLGLLTSVFFIFSALPQPVIGVIVDRVGAKAILFAGLGLEAAATLGFGLFPDYVALVVLSALAGLGNSVFHPTDFSILSASIHESRMGRAFSAHAFSGFVGYAAAPVVMVGLAQIMPWQSALILVGAVGLAYLVLLIAMSGEFRDSKSTREERPQPSSLKDDISLVLKAPIILFFVFFVLLASSQLGLTQFIPAGLEALHGLDPVSATAAVTAFLWGMPVGVILGGFAADRTTRHELLTMICLSVTTIGSVFTGFVDLGAVLSVIVLFISGVFFGAFFPSRDLLVRSVTPEGASGKVFGFVYTGLDVGAILVGVSFGLLIDAGRADLMFALAGLGFVLAIGCILMASRVSARTAITG